MGGNEQRTVQKVHKADVNVIQQMLGTAARWLTNAGTTKRPLTAFR